VGEVIDAIQKICFELATFLGNFIVKRRIIVMTRSSMFTLFLSVLMLVFASVCFGQIIFQEDWESGVIDENIWIPGPEWKIVDGMLEAGGGEGEDAGFSVQNDFTDFELSIDARIGNGCICCRPGSHRG